MRVGAGVLLLGFLCIGLLAGGLRSPAAWTAFSAGIWLVFLSQSKKLAEAPLKAWAPWLLWALLSALASDQPLKCAPALARWSGLVAFFALARSLWSEKERRLWLLGLCGTAAILGLAGLWTGQVGHWRLAETMTGLMPPYYNYTAFVEAAAAAALLAALGHPRGPRGRLRLAAWGLFSFLVVLILLARSRGALGAVVIAAAFSMVRRGAGRRLALAALLLAAGGAAVTAFMVVSRGASPAYLLKLDRVFARPQLWRAAFDVARDHPILGEGPGNFSAGYLRHNFVSSFGISRYQYYSDYAHSEVLQAAAETGWPGLALLLLALALSLRLPGPSQAGLEQEAALGAFVAMTAQCLADDMLHMPALGMLYLSALACAPVAEPPGERAPRGLAAALGAGGLALALSAWIPAALAERGDGGLQSAERAVRLFPGEASLREDLARAWITARPPRADEALAELERASEMSPTNALYPVMRAELLRQRGEWARTLGLAELALTLEPAFLQARLLRAESLARLGRRPLAREELKRAEDLRAWLDGQRAAGRVGGGYEGMVAALDERRFELVRNFIESGHG